MITATLTTHEREAFRILRIYGPLPDRDVALRVGRLTTFTVRVLQSLRAAGLATFDGEDWDVSERGREVEMT